MQAVMARIRITIDCEDAHKRAFLSAAGLAGKNLQEYFEWMVEQLCPEDLERARRAIQGDDPDADDTAPKPKPRRKSD